MAKESDSIEVLGYEDFYQPMNDYLEHDGYPGLPTCFRSFNEFYSHKQGGVTDWTGFPASGKTYVALELLMGLSEKYGKRHGLYVPDIGSNREIMQKLIKMRTGKDFSNKYQNKITSVEMAKALPWIMHHFLIFKKKDFKKGITPLAFYEKVAEYKDDGGRLDTGLCDSWKNFKHLFAGREDTYLDETLSIRNEMAEDYQVHFHTIAHAGKPTTTEPLPKGGGPAKRKIPTADDIKGGSAWNSNGRSIITVDWPDKSSTGTDIYFNKVKPEDVGKIGSVQGKIKLDPRKGRYYEVIGMNNYFSYEWEKMPVQEEMSFGQKVENLSNEQEVELPF